MTSDRRGRDPRCPALKPSSATAASAGTCSPASTGQVVGRNIFLDGNTDGYSLRVSHRPFVAEAQAGLAVTYHGVRLTYTQVLRTPDFYEQNRWTQFGSFNITFR